MNIRDRLWVWLRRRTPEGSLLPRWLIIARCILFPVQAAGWYLSSRVGYIPSLDVYRIHGAEYTGDAMRALAESTGQVFMVARIDGAVSMVGLAEGMGLQSVVPTHRCTECGALWRYWRKEETGLAFDTWSAVSVCFGVCCDSAEMGGQIVPVLFDDLF